jgi:ATP-dependent exoDNAse (exonuclease V) beta subunit
MTGFRNKIITASAGTGKTYQLAIEYIRIVLGFLGKPDFRLDNVLVLTFTRKATAEIRERIGDHIRLLLSTEPGKQKDKSDLVRALKLDNTANDITMEDKQILVSAINQISSDKRNLQVMTIDAYVNSIFRNIVRPLRSIDKFEIDLQAEEKRLPFLLEHLMTPALKEKLDSLIRSKISPSLDDYSTFFKSLIRNRWLLYQIQRSHRQNDPNDPDYKRHHTPSWELESQRDDFLCLLSQLIDTAFLIKPDKETKQLFNSDFCRLFMDLPDTPSSLYQKVVKLCETPQGCNRFLHTFIKKNLINGTIFSHKSASETVLSLYAVQHELRTQLADYLVNTLFLKEQDEIETLWKIILKEYDKLIYRYKNMTYNDVAWFTLEALFSEEPPTFDLSSEVIATEFYQFLAHRSRFILIDEFQDTSLIQFALLKPILEEVTAGEGSKAFGGLIVVGDEKQSIFSWRGGERDLLLQLPVLLPALREVNPEVMDVSYRSSPTIMDFINGTFQSEYLHNTLNGIDLSWLYPHIQSGRESLDAYSQIGFQTAAYNTRGAENNLRSIYQDFVRSTIKPALQNHPGESAAVLCRKNRELTELQKVLDEEGITSIFQPSSKLPDHLWVAPLISWIRFLAFHDWLDFLAVLRSNYIMLKAKPLKRVLQAISRSDQEVPDFMDTPRAAELLSLSRIVGNYPLRACQHFMDIYLECDAASERDHLNIHAFISVLGDYELSATEQDKTLTGFLDYLDENRDQEFMNQVAVQGKDTLQLLTIHKSKGLEFDRVFVFYDLSGGRGWGGAELKWFTDYQKGNLEVMKDYAFTYHYEDILKCSSLNGLTKAHDNRLSLEELNTIYVAFTRAKWALHICFAYQGNEGWDTYLKAHEGDSLKLPAVICEAVRNYFASRDDVVSEGTRYFLSKETAKKKEEEKKQPAPMQKIALDDLAKELPAAVTEPFAGCEANPVDEDKNWKQIWLVERKNLLGDLAHHYLSFLKHGHPSEHEYAYRQCLVRFGSLLSEREIKDYLDGLKDDLPVDRIFPDGYDKVFTELTVFFQGKELRIDRLLLDTVNKKALILDYKTGDVHDPGQLETYKLALLNMKVISEQGFSMETEYIKI